MLSTTKRPELRRPVIAAGGLAVAGLLALTIARGPAPETAAPPAAPPPPAPIPPAPAPVAPPPPVPSADGLRLFGLLGRGAVIALADGRQSFFAIGREVRPGLSVARVEQDHVVLASAGGELRLRFDGAAPVEAAPAVPAAQATGGAGARRDEALTYRFGLEARRSNGRISGYALRPGANLPLLQRAGLRPGDVIVSVNGQHFDSDEKVLELPSEIAGSFTAEFEFERGGRRMRASLEVNPRS